MRVALARQQSTLIGREIGIPGVESGLSAQFNEDHSEVRVCLSGRGGAGAARAGNESGTDPGYCGDLLHSGAVPGADPASIEGSGAGCEHPGATGGYRLAREPEAISLSEILMAMDPASAQGDETGGDPRSINSVLESVWDDVRAAERAVLARTTVAELAGRCSPREWVI